jgi:PAS domain S-box-containing protein
VTLTSSPRARIDQESPGLRQSEEPFRLSFENASIGMALVAPEGRFLKVNRALCKILGVSEPDLLETDFQAITHPDDLEADLEFVRQMLAGEIRTYTMDKRYVTPQGHTVWANLSVSLARDSAGAPLYFISQVTDITASRRAEQRFAALVESAPDAMVIVGADGVIQLVNRQTELLFGYRREELIGKPMELLLPEAAAERHVRHRHAYFADPHHRPMAPAWSSTPGGPTVPRCRWRSASARSTPIRARSCRHRSATSRAGKKRPRRSPTRRSTTR